MCLSPVAAEVLKRVHTTSAVEWNWIEFSVKIVPHNARTTGKNGKSGLYSSLSEMEQIEDITITFANSRRAKCLKRARQ